MAKEQTTGAEQANTEQVQVVPFNPFTILTIEQLEKLAGRFSKQWLAANEARIDKIALEFPQASQLEVYFAAELQRDADAMLTADKIKDAVKAMMKQLRWVNGKDGQISLDAIRKEYESIPTASRKDCGIKFRDEAYSTFAGDQAAACLQTVYVHLGVTESDWKRKK